MIYSLGNRRMETKGENYFIADSADVIGAVVIENNVSIWYNVVIRGDIGTITIGECSNIQDGSVLHTDMEGSLTIGKGASVGHMAVLHNCEIGDNTLIGINAVVLSRAKIGKNCIIGANTLVTQGKEIPDNSLVIGSPCKIIRDVTPEEIDAIKATAKRYVDNLKRYKDGSLNIEE